MPINFPRQKAGSYGVQRVYKHFQCAANPLTANTTVIFYAGGFAQRKVRFVRFGATCSTVAADADGTILATCRKYDANAASAVTLSDNLDLEAMTARKEAKANCASATTEVQRTFQAQDTVEFHVVNNSAAIDTQPANLTFVAEFEVLE